jgi:hypothetical protein
MCEDTEIVDKIRALEGGSPPIKDIVNRLYGILTVLDTKASGLLRVNGLFLTLLVFFLGWYHKDQTMPDNIRKYIPVAYVDTVLLVISSFLCLSVMSINWKFFGRVVKINGSYNFDIEIHFLSKVVNDRTHFYWGAWLCTFISLYVTTLAPFVVH